MCGIVGKLNFNGTGVSEKDIAQMNSCIAHRGPDDSGVFVEGPVGLGHQRLSIVDLSAKGHQPMVDAGGRYTIVFNGEIYNYRKLREELKNDGQRFTSETDTEVLIYLYAKLGTAMLEKLQGMFALAIWDAKRQELFIARDRVGKKPFKYYMDENRFMFASELKTLLVDSSVPRQVDWSAIDLYLTYKYVPGPQTGFKDIYKLLPGHFGIVKNATLEIHQYWDVSFKKKQNLSEEEWLKKGEKLIRAAVKKRLHADVPIGAHLSGGVDSSLIVALASEEGGKQLSTFSIGFEEDAFNERDYARLVAKQYNTDHHEHIVRPEALTILPELAGQYEEPFADASAIPTWYLSQQTKQYMTVALNGDGGDEVFGGYERHLVARIHKILAFVPMKRLGALLLERLKVSGMTHMRLDQLHRILHAYDRDLYRFYRNIIAVVKDEYKQTLYSDALQRSVDRSESEPARAYFESAQSADRLDALLYLGMHTHLPDQLLVKVDIASMAHALEVRSPLLDHKLIEFMATTPSALKVKGFNKKYLLKKIAEKYVPRECIYRAKQGFRVPLSDWFRGELHEYVRSRLLDPSFLAYGFEKHALITMLDEHKIKKVDRSNELYTLLMLRLWLARWFES